MIDSFISISSQEIFSRLSILSLIHLINCFWVAGIKYSVLFFKYTLRNYIQDISFEIYFCLLNSLCSLHQYTVTLLFTPQHRCNGLADEKFRLKVQKIKVFTVMFFFFFFGLCHLISFWSILLFLLLCFFVFSSTFSLFLLLLFSSLF